MVDSVWKRQAAINPLSNWADGVWDGDTIDLLIDCGFNQFARQRIRVLGVNTPEMRGHEKSLGILSRQKTLEWLSKAKTGQGRWPLIIETKKVDNFGRWLATVQRKSDGQFLTDYLLDLGYPEYSG